MIPPPRSRTPRRSASGCRDSNPRDYILAADFLNINQIDVAVIQHEFGIFGGESGVYVLALARRLRMPLITTLHTVVASPTPQQRKIILALAAASERLVVLCETARGILGEVYGIDTGKIVFIPHGIPDLPFSDPEPPRRSWVCRAARC